MYTREARGFSLIEIIVASAVIVAFVIGVTGALQAHARLVGQDVKRTQAALLIEETAEALQLLRDQSWEDYIEPLTLGTTYYLHWSGSAYAATTTAQMVNSTYSRTFVLAAVERDASDNITESGTVDTDTRKITVTVSATSSPSIMESSFLLHNTYEN